MECEFDETNPELPCNRCVSKRYACGEKTFGPNSQIAVEGKRDDTTIVRLSPVYRTLGSPCEELLLPNDMFYLQFYDTTFRKLTIKFGRIILVGYNVVYLRHHNFDITSRPIRAALLAFASLSLPTDCEADTYAYYGIYYRTASESIAKKDVVSLMYASYVMALVSCLHEASTHDALVHCAQFCRTVQAFSERTGVSAKELSRLKELWLDVIRTAYLYYWFDQYRHEWNEAAVRSTTDVFLEVHRRDDYVASNRLSDLNDLAEMLTISMPFVLVDAAQCFDPYVQLHCNSTYMQVYMERRLFEVFVTREIATSTSTMSLHSVLVQIISLIEHLHRPPCILRERWLRCYNSISLSTLPDLRSNHDILCTGGVRSSSAFLDIGVTILYISSRLLLNLLCCDLDRNEDEQLEVHKSALATVHLLRSAESDFSKEAGYSALLRRTLFWAGLILYKRADLKGNMKQSILC